MSGIFTPANIVVFVIVVVVLYLGGKRIYDGVTKGKSCCSDGSEGVKVKKVEVADTDEANYPYTAELLIGGMSCEGCAENVANALNGVADTWATVDLAEKTATVRSKHPIDEPAYEAAVKAAGYYVMKL